MFTTNGKSREEDYRKVLSQASGNIFISGITMEGIVNNSWELLQDKGGSGDTIKILMVDPSWAERYSEIFGFSASVAETAKDSLLKLKRIINDNISVSLYSFFLPIVLTGYEKNDKGLVLFELVDYLPDSKSPRASLYDVQDNNFKIVKEKFEFYWDNSTIVRK